MPDTIRLQGSGFIHRGRAANYYHLPGVSVRVTSAAFVLFAEPPDPPALGEDFTRWQKLMIAAGAFAVGTGIIFAALWLIGPWLS